MNVVQVTTFLAAKSIQTDSTAPVIHQACENHANKINYLHDGRKMDRVEMSDYRTLSIFATAT